MANTAIVVYGLATFFGLVWLGFFVVHGKAILIRGLDLGAKTVAKGFCLVVLMMSWTFAILSLFLFLGALWFMTGVLQTAG